MRASSFTLNPSWPHLFGTFTVALSMLVGLARYIILDWSDSIRCGALLNRGTWLDEAQRNWQPDGCMLHSYKPVEATACLKSKPVVFIGDSVTRNLFFQFANILDPALPTLPEGDNKHSDHTLQTKSGSNISFFWDPFLNKTQTYDIIGSTASDTSTKQSGRPALLVLGSGLWYLRYANASGGSSSWEANMEHILGILTQGSSKPADEVVLLPVEQVVASKLSYERALTMHSSDIDAMNSDLLHRVSPPEHNALPMFSSPKRNVSVALPLVFNQMLHPSQTTDGLHFSDTLVRLHASILLNLRCNDVLPKSFPLDKTCCNTYPQPSGLQLLFLGLIFVVGPAIHILYHRLGNLSWTKDARGPTLVLSFVVALLFLADRTGLWLKEHKQFNPWIFSFLSISSLLIGLATTKRADKDLGFLNREQTDEWKGWMQVAILIYHYCGASKTSGIYNPIRVLVASYLFMTGYGHTTFYLKKKDFGFLRVAQVMVRLNLLTLVLAYTMNTDYISYYFSPLVSMWFLIIYATMVAGSRFNDRTIFIVCKFALSAILVTWFMSEPWLLETFFQFLRQFFGIRWSAREWAFRVGLDIWIVYVGMLAALVVIKIREYRLTDHPYWPFIVKSASGASSVAIFWFFGFELYQESKFTYNLWHPYISFIPVLAFIVLRNASVVLRSASSRAFAFVGRCSLETFIIQYHFWLAGDSKGVLLVLPGSRWRPVNFVITTIMFIYVSDQTASATTFVTAWICGGAPKALPVFASASSRDAPSTGVFPNAEQEVTIPLIPTGPDCSHKGGEDLLPPEPDTPGRSPRWIDRLAESSIPVEPTFQICDGRNWSIWFTVKTRLLIGVALMWILNIMWQHPK